MHQGVQAQANSSYLTRIPTQYCVYLIDTGYEGRARDSRPPQPHPPGDLFLTGGNPTLKMMKNSL